VVRHSL